MLEQDVWNELAAKSYADYDHRRQVLLRSADTSAAQLADKLLTYKDALARQAGEQPHNYTQLVAHCRSAAQDTRTALLTQEENLFKQLANGVVDLFMHLRQACREWAEQNAAMNVGRNIELELLQFNNRIKASIKERKDFLDALSARRRSELEQWCTKVAAEVETALHAAAYPDDTSTIDGSISDLLADEDDETADGSITDILDASAGDAMSTRDVMSTHGDGLIDGSITDILSTFDTVVTMSSCCSNTVGTRGSSVSARQRPTAAVASATADGCGSQVGGRTMAAKTSTAAADCSRWPAAPRSLANESSC